MKEKISIVIDKSLDYEKYEIMQGRVADYIQVMIMLGVFSRRAKDTYIKIKWIDGQNFPTCSLVGKLDIR